MKQLDRICDNCWRHVANKYVNFNNARLCPRCFSKEISHSMLALHMELMAERWEESAF